MSEHKKLIFNPVMAAPWTSQARNYHENPSLVLSRMGNNNKRGTSQIANLKSKTNENMQILIMRFPGLKKYQARAALALSNNQLNKAIVLLEVSKCYSKDVVNTNTDLAYLRNIQINLWYDTEVQDPTLRNIMFESFFRRDHETVSYGSGSGEGSVNSVGKSQSSEERVGVVIMKTSNGYRATLL